MPHLIVPTGVFHFCCCLDKIPVFNSHDHFPEVSEPVGAKVKSHIHHHPPHRLRQSLKILENGFQILNALPDIILQQHQGFFFRDAFVLKVSANPNGQLACRAMVGFQSQTFGGDMGSGLRYCSYCY